MPVFLRETKDIVKTNNWDICEIRKRMEITSRGGNVYTLYSF